MSEAAALSSSELIQTSIALDTANTVVAIKELDVLMS
jgi:hypothetical protein